MDAGTSPSSNTSAPPTPITPASTTSPTAAAPPPPLPALSSSAAVLDVEISHLITRLSGKSSVQSLLVLSRKHGGIIRSSGSISRSAPEQQASYATAVWQYVKASEELVVSLEDMGAPPAPADDNIGGAFDVRDAEREERGEKEREREQKEKEVRAKDDIRLLRVRTKTREAVVVPDAKYILVVFHDTPTAP